MKGQRNQNRRTSRVSSTNSRRVSRVQSTSNRSTGLATLNSNATMTTAVSRRTTSAVTKVRAHSPTQMIRSTTTSPMAAIKRRQFSTEVPFNAPRQLFQNLNPAVSKHLVDTQHERDITELQDVFQMEILSRLTSPNNWSPTMVTSRNLEEAQAHTRSFYRTVLRMTPSLLRQYDLSELRPLEVAKVIRSHFERYPNVNDPAVMDTLRWNAQVDFTDVVRMYFTQSNVISALFMDTHPQMLPKLPTEALPATTDQFVAQIHERPTDFLAEFLDPQESQRKARSSLYSISQI